VAQLTSDIRTRHDRLDALHAQRQAQQAVNDRSEPESTDLASLRNELTALVATYTEENPLVKRTRQRIAELVGSVSNAAAPGDATNSPAAPGLDPMSMEIATIEGDIKALESDREREGNNIASYRSRVGDAPRLQQELLELTRGYDQVKQQFVTAVAQTEQARRAQDLEESKKGEQFQIQDLASPPTTPYKPNTLRYLVAGVGLGLLVGVGTLGARDLVVQTVRGEEEFAAQFPDLPIYGVIPSLASRPGPPDRPYTSSSRIDPRNA
jgi:uncharacterized protein involved in exopolysaccharide biosynthesis